jgi:hypothetical protein
MTGQLIDSLVYPSEIDDTRSARTRELWVSGQGRKADPAGCLRLRLKIDTKK